MKKPNDLIPPPSVVRTELAHTVRKARLLRGLLKLSVQANKPIGFAVDPQAKGPAEQPRPAA